MRHGVLHDEAPAIPGFPGLSPSGVLLHESLRHRLGGTNCVAGEGRENLEFGKWVAMVAACDSR